jgi:hypothetical protein
MLLLLLLLSSSRAQSCALQIFAVQTINSRAEQEANGTQDGKRLVWSLGSLRSQMVAAGARGEEQGRWEHLRDRLRKEMIQKRVKSESENQTGVLLRVRRGSINSKFRIR